MLYLTFLIDSDSLGIAVWRSGAAGVAPAAAVPKAMAPAPELVRVGDLWNGSAGRLMLSAAKNGGESADVATCLSLLTPAAQGRQAAVANQLPARPQKVEDTCRQMQAERVETWFGAVRLSSGGWWQKRRRQRWNSSRSDWGITCG